MLSDFRYAARQMVKSPGFAIIAILTLGLGIGANTAIFSLINALLLKPLPYPEAERLVQITQQSEQGFDSPVSGGIFMEWEDNSTQFESMAAFRQTNLNLTGIEEPVRLSGLEVTADYFRTLGVRPFLGSDFTPENDLPGGLNQAVILTETLWRTRFGGDPEIIGRSIMLDDQEHSVLGIVSSDAFIFSGVEFVVPAAIRALPWKQTYSYSFVGNVIGRLKPAASFQTAQSELLGVKANHLDLYPDMMKEWGIQVESLQEASFGGFRPYVITLLVAVGLVLLVACANVANLLLARAAARQGEMAIRASLGASGWRIARQLLCESFLLAALGGLFGLLVGALALKPLAVVVDLDQLSNFELSIDANVMIFALAASALTGLIFGAFPAIKAARMGMSSRMRDANRSSTSGSRHRVQSALIIGEVALTVALLACIGFLLKSFALAFQADPGFRRENVLVFELSRTHVKAPTPADKVAFVDQVVSRLSQIPGVESAAVTSSVPMNGTGNYFGGPVWRDDQPERANTYFAGFDGVGADYFKTVGIPMLSGRDFNRADQLPDSAKVLIVDQQLVDDLFPDQDPIGRHLRFAEDVWEIVGVVGGIRRFSLDNSNNAMVYQPTIHFPWYTSYVVKTAVPPLTLTGQVAAAVRELDADQPIDRIRTLEQSVRDSLGGRVIMVSLIGVFGVLSIFLAVIGIYGVISYLVEQRSREFGIRMAIGALPNAIVGMVLKRGVVLAAIGLVIGALVAALAGRPLAFILYEVDSYDPLVLAAVAAITIFIAMAASWLPARMASRINPTEALRAE